MRAALALALWELGKLGEAETQWGCATFVAVPVAAAMPCGRCDMLDLAFIGGRIAAIAAATETDGDRACVVQARG